MNVSTEKVLYTCKYESVFYAYKYKFVLYTCKYEFRKVFLIINMKKTNLINNVNVRNHQVKVFLYQASWHGKCKILKTGKHKHPKYDETIYAKKYKHRNNNNSELYENIYIELPEV